MSFHNSFSNDLYQNLKYKYNYKILTMKCSKYYSWIVQAIITASPYLGNSFKNIEKILLEIFLSMYSCKNN